VSAAIFWAFPAAANVCAFPAACWLDVEESSCGAQAQCSNDETRAHASGCVGLKGAVVVGARSQGCTGPERDRGQVQDTKTYCSHLSIFAGEASSPIIQQLFAVCFLRACSMSKGAAGSRALSEIYRPLLPAASTTSCTANGSQCGKT
jgi:hypothetical protein